MINMLVPDSENTIMDEMLGAFSEVIDIEQQLDDIRFDIESGKGDIDALVLKQTRLQERFEELDGFFYKVKLKVLLKGWDLAKRNFLCVSTVCQEDKRQELLWVRYFFPMQIYCCLMSLQIILILSRLNGLRAFYRADKTAFIVISHDRYFLDRVTNKTFEMENGRFRSYNGNYSAYMAQREIDKKTEERNYANTMAEIERLESIVEQQRRWNRERNIKTAESKQKVIDKLESTLVKPVETLDDMTFKFKACEGGGQDVVTAQGLSMKFGEKTIFKNAQLHIKKGEKVFILVPNGCGKTTLLKILMGKYTPSSGEYKIGSNIFIGYYDQIQENLDMNKTVFDEVYDEYPNMSVTEIRNALAVFLFRGEDVFKEIKKLSGGERARVELVKLMLKTANFLVMDEPTNHLDIDSREALENALSDYDGTMLMVSHDRYFINKLADRIIYMTEDGLESYNGGYDYFLEHRRTETVEKEKKEIPKNIEYKEHKRLAAEKRKVINRFKKVEENVSSLEDEIDIKNKLFENPEIATDFVKANDLQKEIETLESELEKYFSEWEELQALIDENGYEV